MIKNSIRFCSALVAIVALSAGAARAAELTFAKDVAPIMLENCQGCHRPGEAVPMTFMSYDEVRPWAKSIKKAVEERIMPPWHADASIGHWKNERRLTEDQIKTIVSWVDQGAALGNPADLPPAKTYTPGWKIGEPDKVFTMMKEETLPDTLKDEYRYVMIPTGFKEDRWVEAVEVRPGNLAVVHHVIVFLTTPQMMAGGGGQQTEPGGEPAGIVGGLGGYAPGLQPTYAPEGHGLHVPANAIMVLQMHYNKEPGAGTATTDRTSIGMRFCDSPVVKQIRNEAIGDLSFAIPPGADNHEVKATYTAPDDITVSALLPHMHVRGKDMKVWAEFPDGRKQDLIFVPRYDFNWQTAYEFVEPVKAPKGTKFTAVAHFDNSTNNPHNPDPTKEVRWGLPTYDEMMFAFMDFTLDSENLNVKDPGTSPAPAPSAGSGGGR